MSILLAISFSHLLNDMMQSLLPAMYPMLKSSYRLSFVQIGLLTFTYQITASLLQPIIGAFTDRKPKPYSLAVGMGFTLCGLLLLAIGAQLRRCCWSPPPWSAPAPASFIRNPRAWRAWPPAARTDWRSPYSRWAAMSVRPSVRCSQPSSCCHWARGVLPWFGLSALLGIFVLTRVGHWARDPRLRAPGAAGPQGWRRSRPSAPDAGARRHRGAAGPDLQQVLLPGEPHQLLHLLSDRAFPSRGAQRPDHAVHLPRAPWPWAPSSADRWAIGLAARS